MEGEKRPFIYKQNPVSLKPAWEGQMLSNDDRNLKGKVHRKELMSSINLDHTYLDN